MRRLSSFIALIACISLLVAGCGSPLYMGQQPSTQYRQVGPRTLSGELVAVRSVAVSPGTEKPILDIRGDYLRATPTAGQAAASTVAEAIDELSVDELIDNELFLEDPRVILLAPIILPLAAIFAAAGAKVQQQIQEFRDELTEDLAEDIERPSPNIELASVLHSNMHRVPHVESTLVAVGEPIPDNVDAVLETWVSDLDINVQGDNGTFTTTVVATLTDRKNGGHLFRKSFEYSVKGDLGNWARNDNALLRDYGIGARQYFARRISDEFFGKVYLRHVLRVVKTGPGVLSWELVLLGEDEDSAWADAIRESDARYDLEVFDGSQLAYSAYDIEGMSHSIPEELEPCKSYSWTVRPIYYFEGTARAGEWLAHESVTRRMQGSLNAAGYQGTGAAQQLAIREITEGYPQFKTGC